MNDLDLEAEMENWLETRCCDECEWLEEEYKPWLYRKDK
jgi:hypothetical protein